MYCMKLHAQGMLSLCVHYDLYVYITISMGLTYYCLVPW